MINIIIFFFYLYLLFTFNISTKDSTSFECIKFSANLLCHLSSPGVSPLNTQIRKNFNLSKTKNVPDSLTICAAALKNELDLYSIRYLSMWLQIMESEYKLEDWSSIQSNELLTNLIL